MGAFITGRATRATDNLGTIDALPERLPADQVRGGIAWIIAAWGFGAAFFNVTAGAIYVAFARQIGADDFIFGILAAALPLMSFLQVISARLVEHTGKRKLQMMTAGLIGRSLWIVAALIPLAGQNLGGWLNEPSWLRTAGWLKGQQTHALDMVIACVFISSVCQAFTSPPFISWISDLVPARVRPTFLARRVQMGTFVSLLLALTTGWVADNYPSLTVYCVIMAVAGIAGVLDIVLFVSVKEPVGTAALRNLDKEAPPLPPFFASLREPLHDPAVRTYLLFVALFTFSIGSVGPFFWLHMKEVLHFPYDVMALVLNVAPLMGSFSTSRFWGGIIKQYGARPVLRFGSFGLIFVPVMLFITGSNSAVMLAINLFLSGVLFCAVDLTNQTQIQGLSPHIPRSTMTALFSIAAGMSFALASCFCGYLARSLDGMHYELWGTPIVNYHVLFLISLAVRIINATFVAPRLQEPDSMRTLDAVREVVPQIAESVAARITRPFGFRED